MEITGKAKLAGVMGWPVTHSRSPRLHGRWLERYKIDGAYLPLAVRPEDFAEVLAALPKQGFAGVNVTLPHKVQALALADHVEPLARRIGAANTLIFDQDGIHASNTDAYGFLAALHQGAPELELAGQTVLLLGAGGAARAVIVTLLDAGVGRLRLANRTREKAAALAAEFGPVCEVWDWPRRHQGVEDCALLVNTTSLGMVGQAPLELSLDAAPDHAVVMDAVYTPLETPLLAGARARGLLAVDGLGMLLHQARPGFAAWFGVEPAVDDDLRQWVLADL